MHCSLLIVTLVLSFVGKSTQQSPSPDGLSLVWTGRQTARHRTAISKLTRDPRDLGQREFPAVDVYVDRSGALRAITSDSGRNRIIFQNFEDDYLGVYDIRRNESSRHFDDMVGDVEELAYDWLSRNLYWSDPKRNLIMVVGSSLDHYAVAHQFARDQSPYGLAIHPTRRVLFFSLDSREGSKILTSDLSLSNLRAVVTSSDLVHIISIAVDENRLYWVEFSGPLSTTMTSNLEGSDRRILKSGHREDFHGVASFRGTLYVTDTKQYTDDAHGTLTNYAGGMYYKMWMFSPDADTEATFVLKEQPRKVTFLHNGPSYSRGQVTSQGECDASPLCDHICLPRLNTTRQCACAIGYRKVGDTGCVADPLNDDVVLVVDDAQKKIFQLPISRSTDHSYDVLPIAPEYDRKVKTMALNQLTKVVYWSDKATSTIYKLPYNSNQPEVVSEGVHAESMAVDPVTGNVYFSDESTGYIYVMNENGNYLKTLLQRPERGGRVSIRKMQVDFVNRFLYWFEPGPSHSSMGSIWRMNLSGGEPEAVVSRLPSSTYSFDINYDNQSIFYNHQGNSLIETPLSSLPIVHTTNSNKHMLAGIFFFKRIQDFKVVGDIFYLTLQRSSNLYSYDPSRSKPLQSFDSALFYSPTWLEVYRPAYFRRHMASIVNACSGTICHQLCFVTFSSDQVCACADDMELSGSNCIGTGEDANQPPNYHDTCPSTRYVSIPPCEGSTPLHITPPQWTDDRTAPENLNLTNTTIATSYSPGLHHFLFTAEDEEGLLSACYFQIIVSETSCSFDQSQDGDVVKAQPACFGGEYSHNFTCADPEKQLFYQGSYYPYLRNICLRSGQWTIESADELFCSIPPIDAPRTSTQGTTTRKTQPTTRSTPQPTTRSTPQPITRSTTQTTTRSTTQTTTRSRTRSTTQTTTRSIAETTTRSTTQPTTRPTTQPTTRSTQSTRRSTAHSATTQMDTSSLPKNPTKLRRIQKPQESPSGEHLAPGPVAAVVVVCVAVFIALLVALIVVARRKWIVPLSNNNNGFRLFWNNGDEEEASKTDSFSLPA